MSPQQRLGVVRILGAYRPSCASSSAEFFHNISSANSLQLRCVVQSTQFPLFAGIESGWRGDPPSIAGAVKIGL